jgi:glycosyltransferase involved in cell wall biosynthesis
VITAITPTGDRPIAFHLLRRWMSNQTVKPDQWIIIDDGKDPMKLENLQPYEQYIRREPNQTDPKHTLVVNVDHAIPFIKGDKVFFCEDDEYYAPTYIERMISHLEKHQVVGIGCSKYYHLPTGGYEQHGNMQHASLAQTAFDISVLSMVKHCIGFGMEIQWLDDRIWKEVVRANGKISSYIFIDQQESLYVGMKGLPGRTGIGIGHKPKTYKRHDDENRSKLKEWMPSDYSIYLEMLG